MVLHLGPPLQMPEGSEMKHLMMIWSYNASMRQQQQKETCLRIHAKNKSTLANT